MQKNYHTHTPRCHHADGSEREYIESAIDAGFILLGFSDHAPYLFDSDYVSRIRMLPEELRGYCDVLLALREEYRGRLELKIGLEMEYYPRFFADQTAFLKDYPLDYLILGQHALFNELDGVFSGRPTEDEKLLDQYVGQCIDGLQSGLYSYLAHPDLFAYVGDPKIYDRYMRKLCRAANELRLPLEINLLGMSEGKQYPNPAFWRIAGEEGVTAVLGVDAHDPRDFQTAPIADGLRLAAEFGLRVIEDVPLRSPV